MPSVVHAANGNGGRRHFEPERRWKALHVEAAALPEPAGAGRTEGGRRTATGSAALGGRRPPAPAPPLGHWPRCRTTAPLLRTPARRSGRPTGAAARGGGSIGHDAVSSGGFRTPNGFPKHLRGVLPLFQNSSMSFPTGCVL
ncbi:hypothetical protein ISCGN_031465 [Ixodes scapularis]